MQLWDGSLIDLATIASGGANVRGSLDRGWGSPEIGMASPLGRYRLPRGPFKLSESDWDEELFEVIRSGSRPPKNPVAFGLRESGNRRADGAHPSGISRRERDYRPIRPKHQALRPKSF